MPLPLTSNAVPARIEAPWHRHLLASAAVGAVALLTLTGCSSSDPLDDFIAELDKIEDASESDPSSNAGPEPDESAPEEPAPEPLPPLEPAPGQIDYDIAVSRAAITHGLNGGLIPWDPWIKLDADQLAGNTPHHLEDSDFEEGLDVLCAPFGRDPDKSSPHEFQLGVIGNEVIRGALVSQASPEFRQAASAVFTANVDFDGEPGAYDRALDLLATDFYDEWVDLYALQEKLYEEVFTVEGAQAAEAVLAERCEYDLPSAEVTTDPMYRASSKLLTVEPYQGSN